MPYLEFKGRKFVENFHFSVPHHAFEFDADLSVLHRGDQPSLEGNLIIEGDNLIALKALLPTHAGRIKCVYIDPPYNTGNEGWVYNDNLTAPQFKDWFGKTVGNQAEDATRHDKWCCMMYPRLQLLKDLLSQDGAIFVSIDDNEVHHLRALMDEIFGQENFIATIIWEKVYSPKSSARHFSENHDFVVIYARSKPEWERFLLPRTEEANARYSNPDNDPRGSWTSGDVSARNFYDKGTYSITCPGGRVLEGPPPGTYWRVSEDRLWELHADNRIWWGEDKNNVPRIKRFLSEVKQGLVPETIWTYNEVGHTQDAKKEVLQIFGNDYETILTPKPVALIKKIVHLSTEPGDIILDSFSGSGTTAQAVLEMNKEDTVGRQFVLVQQPYDTKEDGVKEFNICEKITAERVRRVIQGYPFHGNQAETILEEKVTLNSLKKADELTRRIDEARNAGREKFDDVRAVIDEGVVRVEGIRNIAGHKDGTGGSFTYARLNETPLFGEGTNLSMAPAFEDLARYIFFTHTSRSFDPAHCNKVTGFIGEHNGTGLYLLYDPNSEADRRLDAHWLKGVGIDSPYLRLAVYAEAIALHRQDLREWCAEHGRDVQFFYVPFELK